MLNLFDVIPNNFFNFLGSGSNNRIYAQCLSIIYNAYENEISYRLPRSQIRDTIAVYLTEIHPELEDEDGNTQSNYTDMASNVIRRMCSNEVGWLEEDADEATYEKQIIMTEQGIMLAEFLERLMKPEREEFASYIYNIYNTLNNVEQWKSDPYSLCLASVYRNSRNLAKALKKLATFIRKIIENMMNENSFESLTENLIAYCEGDFIKEYSRLTKKQNIHTYRYSIVEKLKEFETNEDRFEELVIGCVMETNLFEEEARDKVYDMISKTIYFLENEYDAIMSDIKHKINVYLQIAVGRGKFLRNKGADTRGSIERTIKYIVEEMDEIGLREELPEPMMSLFTVDRNEFIDLDSIRYPAKTKSIKKSVVTSYESLTDEDIVKARQEQAKNTYNPFSKELMKSYIEKQLENRVSISGNQLPMNNKNDLLASLSAVAYSEENGFEIVTKEEYIEVNDMLLHDFEIRRRK